MIKRNGCLLVCLLSLSHAGTAHSQWTQTNGPYMGRITCLAVSGANLFAGTGGGGVFRSIDNGRNWTVVNNGLTNRDVRSLTVSGANLFAGTWGSIFLSTDNGAGWKRINSGLTAVTDIAVIPASDGTGGSKIFASTTLSFDLWQWAVYGGGIFLSTDNGSTWESINDGLMNKDVFALAVMGKDLFAGTDRGVHRLNGNGTSWTRVGLDDISVSALAVNGLSLFAGTVDYGLHIFDDGAYGKGYGVWFTTNNGSSWQNRYGEPVTSMDIHDLALVSNGAGGNKIFAATSNGVFFSDDNGKSWAPVSTGLRDTTVSALAVAGANLFAGTESGCVWRRPLSEMIRTGVEETPETMPAGCSLEQNYPNPFNPGTKIGFTIPRSETVTISVYDLLGREVAVLENSTLPPGYHEVMFNGMDLASGVYFYRIQAGGFTRTRKMHLVR
jgi:hypothetical protein